MKDNKIFALAAAAVILCASCSAFLVVDEEEEPDGIAPIVIALMVIGAGAGGFAGGWFVHDWLDSGDADTQPYMRLAAANNITDVMSVASAFTANANSNYAMLWGMTKEHWIRQAELEAYAKWQSGKDYDGNAVLQGARTYENSSIMTANAVAQIDSFFGDLSEKVGNWSGTGTYSGKMQVGFILDNTRVFSSACDVGGDLISVADSSVKSGKIYVGTVDDGYVVTTDSDKYRPAYVYNFGPKATITSEDGTVYALETGKNYLSDLKSAVGNKAFEPGIFSVSNAVIGGDTLSAVMGSALSLKAGMVMKTDGSTKLAVLDGDSISYAGGNYNSISFKVEASGIPSGEQAPDKIDLTKVLNAYQKLLDKLYWTSVSANNSAAAVWDIYNHADERDFGVTTLMSSNVYDSVVLSKSMNEVLTLSAMQQLATYYDSNGGDLSDLQIGLYGDGMDAPFVRGSVVDGFGNTIYDDVIFTPFFQSESVTLERGVDHTVAQNTMLAVWSDGMELTAWYDGGMNTGGYETVFIEKGHTLRISQLAVCDDAGMHNEPEVEFKVTKVDWIPPEDIHLTDDPDPDSAGGSILKIICIAAGAILAVLGIVRKDPIPIVAGIVLIVFGALFADRAWALISGLVRL